METALIQISKRAIGTEEVNSVDARELHKFLKSGQKFADWAESKLIRNPFFKEEVDYIVFRNIANNIKGGRPRQDYALTIDTAKKVAMAEQTAQGEKVRNYFLQCEKQAKSKQVMIPDFTNPAESARAWALEYEEKQKALVLVECKNDAINELIRTKAQISDSKTAKAMATASAKARENERLREQIGDSKKYKQVKAIPWLGEYFNRNDKEALEAIGHYLSRLSKMMDLKPKKIEDSTWDFVNAYHRDVINKFRQALDGRSEPVNLTQYRLLQIA